MCADQVVQAGDRVDIRFVLSLADGTVVDQTEGDEVLQLKLGEGTLADGLERCLIGMKVGERRQFKLFPEEAFGNPVPENMTMVPKSRFPAGLVLEEGMIVGFDGPAGEEIPGTILKIEDESVLVDFNHPLAGQVLFFDVTVVQVDSEVGD